MSALAAALKPRLDELSVEDRAEIAAYLLESLGPEVDGAEDAAFDAELERRAEEMCSGKVEGELAEDVFARLRSHRP